MDDKSPNDDEKSLLPRPESSYNEELQNINKWAQ